MRFQFDKRKSSSVKRKHGVKPIAPKKPTAEEIADMASRREDVSSHFTGKFTVVRPIHRMNVDLTQGMLRELDERAARFNISRQAAIKTLLAQALREEREPKRRPKPDSRAPEIRRRGSRTRALR